VPYIPPIIIGSTPQDDISDRVTELSVNLTTDEVSQIQMTVTDRNLEMLKANYFQIRQPVQYLGNVFEIAAMEVSQGAEEQVTLQLRPSATQQLKRDKASQVSASGGLEYVARKAREVGLRLFMEFSSPTAAAIESESTPKDTSTNTGQNNGPTAADSAWDTIKKVADDYQYIVFEIDNRLFFCSEPFLLGKFGVAGYGANPGFIEVPLIWNSNPRARVYEQNANPIAGPPARPRLELGNTGVEVEYLQRVLSLRAGQTITDPLGTFGYSTLDAVNNLQKFVGFTVTGFVDLMMWNIVDSLASGISAYTPDYPFYWMTPLGLPTLRKSDDAWTAATGDFQIEREQGKLLRPGMTIRMDGVPFFEGPYMVTSVSWNEGTNDPVSVSTRTLVEPKPTSDGKNNDLNRFRAALSWTGGGLANNVIGVPAWSTSG